MVDLRLSLWGRDRRRFVLELDSAMLCVACAATGLLRPPSPNSREIESRRGKTRGEEKEAATTGRERAAARRERVAPWPVGDWES